MANPAEDDYLFTGSRGKARPPTAAWGSRALLAALVAVAAAAGVWYDSEAHPDDSCAVGRHLGAARWALIVTLLTLGGAIATLAYREGRRKGRVHRLEFAIVMRPLSPFENDVFLTDA